jgi:hypothetical protein
MITIRSTRSRGHYITNTIFTARGEILTVETRAGAQQIPVYSWPLLTPLQTISNIYSYFLCFSAACAAASRAIGTRKGEQLT